MHHRFSTVCPDLLGFKFPVQFYARAGRLLLLLASIVLIALPFTQHLWTWDRFLHGGHDFETNSLLIVITLCLVLVLVQSCGQGFRLLINAWARLFIRWRLAMAANAVTACSGCDRKDGPSLDICSNPLQI